MAKQCEYAASRRGGLDRAALAARRKRLAAEARETAVAMALGDLSSTSSISDEAQSPRPPPLQQHALFTPAMNVLEAGRLPEQPSMLDMEPLMPSPPASDVQGSQFLEQDSLFNAYYDKFHKFHPFVLPRAKFIEMHAMPSKHALLEPVVAVMRFIGHLYTERRWSPKHQAATARALSASSTQHRTDDNGEEAGPFAVQARLLYSIVLFWNCYAVEAKREMDAATSMAKRLGMYRREFAVEHSDGDPVLAECWRRTWWKVWIVDAYYAGTLGTLNFAVQDIEATTELPCEEDEYESGVS
jgi:hypothetical protein